MLPISAVLDFNTVSEISKRGYSRIPVFDTERKNIVALLHAKDLAFVDPDDKKPLKTVIEFYKHPLIHTYADETLNNVLNHFKHGNTIRDLSKFESIQLTIPIHEMIDDRQKSHGVCSPNLRHGRRRSVL